MLEGMFVGRYIRRAGTKAGPWSLVRGVDDHGVWMQIIEPGTQAVELKPDQYILYVLPWSDFSGAAWDVRLGLPRGE